MENNYLLKSMVKDVPNTGGTSQGASLGTWSLDTF